MKITFLTCTIVLLSLQSIAQKKANVKDWNKKIFMFHDNYWDNDSTAIIRQIGLKRFQQVKSHSNFDVIPGGMSLFRDGMYGEKADTAILYPKLRRLNMYAIASYDHISEKMGNTGKYFILSVPYSKNENWDAAWKWDEIFFIVPAEQVVIE